MEHPSDHDTLIEVKTNLNNLIQRVEVFITIQGKFEDRLRNLENYRYFLAGTAAACGALGALLVKIIIK